MIDLLKNDIMEFSVAPTGIFYTSTGEKQIIYDLYYAEAKGHINLGSSYWFNEYENNDYGKDMKWNNQRGWKGYVTQDEDPHYSPSSYMYDCLHEYFEKELKKIEGYIFSKYASELPVVTMYPSGGTNSSLLFEVVASNLPEIDTKDVLTEEYPVQAEDFEPGQQFYGDDFLCNHRWTVYDKDDISMSVGVDKLVYKKSKFFLLGTIDIDYEDQHFSLYGDLMNYDTSWLLSVYPNDDGILEWYDDSQEIRELVAYFKKDINRLLELYVECYSKYMHIEEFANFKISNDDWQPEFTLSLTVPNEENEINEELKSFKFKEITKEEIIDIVPVDI